MNRDAAARHRPAGVQPAKSQAVPGETARSGLASAWARLRSNGIWSVCALGAALLVLLATVLPLWSMVLRAPQYPDGLRLVAYGSRMTGDLQEINNLNHYVGIRPIDPDSVRELDLFLPAMALLVVGLLFSALRPRVGRISLRWLVAAVIWAVPVGFLVDLQYWLYDYGHHLDPRAPIRIDEFTPRVVGSTDIVNFNSVAMVSWGFWCFVAAGILVTVGPRIIRFLREAWSNTGTAETSTSVMAGFIFVPFLLFPGPAASSPASPLVDNSVQAAIDAAQPGDTVVIKGGYHEGPVVIDKPLTLIGDERPVIDGRGAEDVVLVTADGVTVRGFIVQGTSLALSREPAAIHLTADGATIEDNEIRDALYGIFLDNSDGHVVQRNLVSSLLDRPTQLRGHGLYLWNSSDNIIRGNRIVSTKDGIFMGFSNRNEFVANTAYDVRYGIHYMYSDDNSFVGNRVIHSIAGAAVMYSRRVTIRDNEFAFNRSPGSGYGILLKDVDDMTIVSNLIHHNRLGLTMEGAPFSPDSFVRIADNLIAYNDIGMEIGGTVDGEFSRNTFLGNLEQVAVQGTHVRLHNTWAQAGQGNYWDDYQGFDADGDGIGDVEYRYEGTFNDLVERSPILRVFRFTFAQAALDLTARWFPLYSPEPRVVDPAPLMEAPMELPGSLSGPRRSGSILLGILLAGLPLALALGARRTFALGAS